MSMGFLPTSIDKNCVVGITLVPTVFFVNDEEAGCLAAPVSGARIQDRIARLEKSPRRADALARARQRLGRWLDAEQRPGSELVALRLAAGLSQRQLAGLLGTQQANVSRLEKCPGNPGLNTLQSWASALGVSIDRLASAIRSTTDAGRE